MERWIQQQRGSAIATRDVLVYNQVCKLLPAGSRHAGAARRRCVVALVHSHSSFFFTLFVNLAGQKNDAMRIATISIFIALVLMSFQIIKTQMQVTVRDELGNTAEGVTVQLFEKEEDYTAEKNVAAEAVTDKKGVAKFKDLKAISYFVLARKGDLNNFGGGEQTGKLEAKKINKVTIVIQ